ncbi:hypothetical protein CC80DRAFT_128659 [Byssothecium circinans]|uniref:Uncharacterized protein n=1 Tax=Byssothecium circinans TaxID=147558 RepID=A0A6A5TR07_9PLEO|nr:hypothetical protein CC80DRAFT_128659 [Byssothecium circinans]
MTASRHRIERWPLSSLPLKMSWDGYDERSAWVPIVKRRELGIWARSECTMQILRLHYRVLHVAYRC